MTKILYAQPIIEAGLPKLIARCEKLKSNGVIPTLKVLLVGQNPASILYTDNKKKFCQKIGADCEIVKLPENITEENFIKTIRLYAQDKKVHGCFVQLPLPKHLEKVNIEEEIPASKDVDGFHYWNYSKLAKGEIGDKGLIPCTPLGIIKMLQFYNIPISGQHCLVIGRRNIVGRPLSYLLTALDATVTLAHSRTKNIIELAKNADIIISAIGKANCFGSELIGNKNQTFIDVGINQDNEGKLCGDFDFEKFSGKVAAISPVPKGVGPMTIFSLGENLLKSAEATLNK